MRASVLIEDIVNAWGESAFISLYKQKCNNHFRERQVTCIAWLKFKIYISDNENWTWLQRKYKGKWIYDLLCFSFSCEFIKMWDFILCFRWIKHITIACRVISYTLKVNADLPCKAGTWKYAKHKVKLMWQDGSKLKIPPDNHLCYTERA